MRKNRFLLAILSACALAPVLTSCGETVTKVSQPFGALYDSSLSDTAHFSALPGHGKLKSLVEAKRNFVLVVLPEELGCVCFGIFCETINRYQKSKNLLVYSISGTQFNNPDNSKFGLNVNSNLATIAIFEGGAVKYQSTADGSKDSFAQNYSVFSEWMNARLSFSDMLYVSKTQLESLYKGTTPFTLGFVRASCGDCSYVADHLLTEYNKEAHSVSYLIDCDVDGIRLCNGKEPSNATGATEDETTAYKNWQTFKDDYGLSNKYTTNFGFDNGYVPTWVHCNPAANTEDKPWGAIDDADVYVNDSLTQLDEKTYAVSNTYFDGTRDLPFLKDADALAKGGCATTNIKGITMGVGDVTVYKGNGYWNHDAAAKFHDPLLKSFFAKYIGLN
jgi:hypothetical protein